MLYILSHFSRSGSTAGFIIYFENFHSASEIIISSSRNFFICLLYSENVNEDLGPHTEKYRQDFPVVAGASNIEVRLLIDEFDSDDYGNIRLILYDNNNQPVANDTFHQLEKYLDVSSKNVSYGEWHIIVSIEKELGANTVNVGGNINVFGRDLNSTIISSQLQNPSDLENSF
jgi:hypothetical protein